MESATALRPHPGLRVVWTLRGLGFGVLLLPLGWLPLLPLGYAIHQTGLNVIVSYVMGAAVILAAAVACLVWGVIRAFEATSYVVGERGVQVNRGLLVRSTTAIPYVQIRGVTVRRGPLLRMMGLGTVQLHTQPGMKPEPAWTDARLEGLENTEELARRILARIPAANAAPTPHPSPVARPASPIVSQARR